MCIKKFQKETQRTLNYLSSDKDRLGELGMGLSGEVGELVNIIKKKIYHHHNVDIKDIKEEMGDILWYLSNIANEYNIGLDEVMGGNIEKLKKRYPDGYTQEDSVNRKDKDAVPNHKEHKVSRSR